MTLMTFAALRLAAALLPALLLLARARAELQPDHRALKAEHVAQRVLQIALVREVNDLRIVDEEDEGGGADLGLRHIVDAQRMALHGRWVVALHGVAYDLVELGSGDTHVTGLVDAQGVIEDRADMVAGLGGGEDNRRVGHELEPLAHEMCVLL